MKITPINCAEAIIEVFWDPALGELEQWDIVDKLEYALVVTQEWSGTNFEWDRCPEDGKILEMAKSFQIDCSDYDYLMLSANATAGTVFVITLETDLGKITHEARPFKDIGKEIYVDLKGAQKLFNINIVAIVNDKGLGILNWIGLHSKERYQWYKKEWERFDQKWEGYLKPESYEPVFKPTYGIVINREELPELRRQHELFIKEHGTSPFIQKVESFINVEPEKYIHEFVIFWEDTRYARERDFFKRLTKKGPALAELALLKKDKRLLRLAARYAMSMAMSKYWNDSFLCEFDAGYWEHRGFVKSIIAHEIGIILDLAGEMFTDLGRDLILRRLGEEALGGINFTTWKHDYIFENNQLIWFSDGRMLAYAIMEQHYKHVKPYTETAYKEIVENINNILYDDGAYGEGPSYYNCIGQSAVLALYYYARLRGLDIKDVVPNKIKLTEDFATCLVSTVDNQDVIPICDGKPILKQDTLAFMTYLLPGSVWGSMLEKSLAREDGMLENLITLNLLGNDLSEERPIKPLKSWVQLEEMGIVASNREINEEPLKVFVMGNKANVDHSHEDKGSFVIEFSGDTFAMDSGSCDYGNVLARAAQHGQRHNMLIPYGVSERVMPIRPNQVDIKVTGKGDATTFVAEVDLSEDWIHYQAYWKRKIEATSLDQLQIIDSYKLKKGEGTIFYWQTQLPVTQTGNQITIHGKKAAMIIEGPEYCTTEVVKVPYFDETYQNSIRIINPRKEDRMVVCVKLRLKGDNDESE